MEGYLWEIQPGERAEVTDLLCPPALQKRLKDLGMVPGTVVSCRYRSPNRDVTALELRRTVIALRTRDLQQIRARRV